MQAAKAPWWEEQMAMQPGGPELPGQIIEITRTEDVPANVNGREKASGAPPTGTLLHRRVVHVVSVRPARSGRVVRAAGRMSKGRCRAEERRSPSNLPTATTILRRRSPD